MALLKYGKSSNQTGFEYSDVSTYQPGWGTWGSTFGRDWDIYGGADSEYVGVTSKKIVYSPSNFSGKIIYKGDFVVPSQEDYFDIRQNASGLVRSIKAVVNGEKLKIKKIDWDLSDIVACDDSYFGVCRPRLETLFSGDDVVKAGSSDIEISTYAGNDKIIGSSVPRSIDAGVGDDYIETRASDSVTGGSGSDVFAIRAGADGATILDFEVGNDQVKLKGKGFDSVSVKSEFSGGYFDTLISWSDGLEVRLLKVDASYEDLFG